MNTIKKKDSFADIRKIILKIRKNWYVFLGLLVVALVAAYFTNLYSQPVYQVTSSVLVKSKGVKNSAAQFLYGSDLSGISESQGVEGIIFQSYPIINKTVKELEFAKQFHIQGSHLLEDAYGKEPVIMQIDSVTMSKNYGNQYIFKVTDKNHFTFQNKEDGKVKKFNFDKLVDYEKLTFRAKKIEGVNYGKLVGTEYIFKLVHPSAVTGRFVNALIVNPANQQGSVLDLAIFNANAKRSIDFLNKLIEVYTVEEIKRKNQIAANTIQFIDEKLKQVNDSLYLIEQQAAVYKSTTKAAQISSSATTSMINSYSNFAAQGANFNIQLSTLNGIISAISSKNYDRLAGLGAAVNDATLSGYIGQLVTQYSSVKGQVGAGQQASANPYVRKALDNIELLRTKIGQSARSLKTTISSQKAISYGQAGTLKQDITNVPLAQRQLVDIERTRAITEKMFLLYNDKKVEAQVAKASTTSDIQIVNPPMRKGGPISDNSRNYLIAFFLGLTLPLAFIIIKDFLSNKIYSKDDIESNTTVPVLGQIWRYSKGDGGMLVVNDAPKSVVAESFRSVRSNLNFFTADVDRKVFVISSSISGEGKTFSSINISTVFALSSKKTILIGADLRKPKIFGDFGLKNEIGLSNYLAGSAFKTEVIQSTSIPNLDVIISGPVPPNPSELLMTQKMADLIEELKEDYEYIIIDTAPLGLVTDAFVLMKYANHSIFMVRQNYTPVEAVSHLQDLYSSGKLKNVSILFNDVKDQANNYGYGYGYYEDGK